MSDIYSDSGFSDSRSRELERDASWESGDPSDRRMQPPAALNWHRFVDWLPRLTTCLWLHRTSADSVFPRGRLLPQGVLLLDHPALAAVTDCVDVVAQGAVTTHGPREWLEFLDAQGRGLGRLYLLPDTDYLAWDAMLADCGLRRAPAAAVPRWHAHTAFPCGAFWRTRVAWQARLVRFPVVQLPCLRVLGLRAPTQLSPLSRQLAVLVASDECAELQCVAT